MSVQVLSVPSSNGNSSLGTRRARGCVVEYASDAFELGSKLVVGRRVAGQNFLRALCRYGSPERLHCLAGSVDEFSYFADRVTEWSSRTKEACWIPEHDLAHAQEAACLVRGDPGIGRLAWRRRMAGARLYSLCGMTHTLCSDHVLDALADLLIAPVQPWDALVCTSQAVHDVVTSVIRDWSEYLQARIGGQPRAPLQLPIIPLGVDCDAFARTSVYKARRNACRIRWNVSAGEVVVLFVGRLSFHAKANPFPLFVAIRQVAEQTRKNVRLVLAGQFPNPAVKTAFLQAWRAVCPGRPLNLVPWSNDDTWWDVWRGADIFVSLVDNIQETFGLTPLEGMAAGLPVVVSDWDGYRDTVRDGVDGYLIPTTMSRAGAGEDLARRYALGKDSYDRYIGYTSAFIGVDIEQTTAALGRLVQEPRLRRRMGEAARQRALQYDWSNVIRQYEDLWEELAARRAKDREIAPCGPGRPVHPLRPDPFRLFATYPSRRLGDDDRLSAAPHVSLDGALKLDVLNLARPFLATRDECTDLLQKLSTAPQSVHDLLSDFPPARHPVVRRTLTWMYKAGLVRGSWSDREQVSI